MHACTLHVRCRANMVLRRQSRPDSGLGFQAKGLASARGTTGYEPPAPPPAAPSNLISHNTLVLPLRSDRAVPPGTLSVDEARGRQHSSFLFFVPHSGIQRDFLSQEATTVNSLSGLPADYRGLRLARRRPNHARKKRWEMVAPCTRGQSKPLGIYKMTISAPRKYPRGAK